MYPCPQCYPYLGRPEGDPGKLCREHELERALDDLVMALELPGDHCETEQALRRAKALLKR